MSSSSSQESPNADTASLEIAVGPVARTRRLAREEILADASGLLSHSQRDGGSNAREVAAVAIETGVDVHFALSPRHIDPQELAALQQRPPVSFTIQNSASLSLSSNQKEDITTGATLATSAVAGPSVPPDNTAKRIRFTRQSWHSPVHVPLSHRKLVAAPSIFSGVAPFPPAVPPSLSVRSESKHANRVVQDSPRGGGAHRLAKLSPRSNQTPSSSEQCSSRTRSQALRERNPEIYDRLVQRFQALRRAETPPHRGASSAVTPLASKRSLSATDTSKCTPAAHDGSDALQQLDSVEDAILFFLNEKHKHDILYFKRKRSALGAQTSIDANGRVTLKPSGLTSSSSSAARHADPESLRYMPYSLERIDTMPKPESGDYYIMSASALVHHANSSSGDIVGEAIPIAQWILESKMFSLLLAGIPLFQKFLVRKVFAGWRLEARQRIYRDLRRRLSRALPIGRHAFVQPMLQSYAALRKIEGIRALSLPAKRSSAAGLTAVQERHKELLTMTETRLIDAKEELLSVMDAMVAAIQANLDPPTSIDELYTTEAAAVHISNTKWKSAPMASLRRRKAALQSQKETSTLDMALLQQYVRMMDYMFTGSVYAMIVGCVRCLASDLSVDDYSGVICASVTISGDTLCLSPSHREMKQVLLEGVARLIRLASNFHFTKNAMAWSKNRGTGSLAAVAACFDTRAQASQSNLQDVLRSDARFDAATRELLDELARWFDEAGRQMVAFESLKVVHTSVHSICSAAQSERQLSPGIKLLSAAAVGSSANSVTAAATAATMGEDPPQPVVSLAKITGISGSELARYLKSVTYRLNLLDRSQHACQKIQSSWRVGFLEIQCRRSISEIFDLITHERELLHRRLCELTVAGAADCAASAQRATLVVEDRPQLIECFCEQMKQVRALKDGEKQLQQDIRNVDEAMRALKRYAPALAADCALQHSALHNVFSKYAATVQAHAKFAAKMLPLITQQVTSALQKYSARVQRLLRTHDELADLATEDELERNVGMVHDIVRELRVIEDASRLYQEYQRMVGLKLVEIPMLGETVQKWGDVQHVVGFALQWRAMVNAMENGVFSDQCWRVHIAKLEAFLPRIRELQERKDALFAARLVEHLRASVVTYLQQLELVDELAHPYVKAHHWQQVLALLDAVNFVSSAGVVATDGSTVTLAFLRSRNLWAFEAPIREITRRAQNDAVTERKLDEMKRRLLQATLPLLRTGEDYEIDIPAAKRLLRSFEDDLLTVQALGQITTSAQLNASLTTWAEEITHFQEVLDLWISAQRDWSKLALVFCLPDVQQSVSTAAFEFHSLDRKWKAMMNAARGASSLMTCLREVISLVFLNNARATSEKLWRQLHVYLSDKRRFFPRLNFLSDDDLLQLIASVRYPSRLSHLISKCYRGIHALQISTLGTVDVSGFGTHTHPRVSAEVVSRRELGATAKNAMFALAESIDESDDVPAPAPVTQRLDAPVVHPFDSVSASGDLSQIVGVHGAITAGESLAIKPLHISSSPEIWLKDLLGRVRQTMHETTTSAMNGVLVDAFERNFDELIKHGEQHHKRRRDSMMRQSTGVGIQPNDLLSAVSEHSSGGGGVGAAAKENALPHRFWDGIPMQVLLLCMNILLTGELTPLVHCERSDPNWRNFWIAFYRKKMNLADFISRRDSSAHDRVVAATLLTWLLNKSAGIHELFEDRAGMMGCTGSGGRSASAMHCHGYRDENSSSLFRYNYAASECYTWLKMPRFHYEPSENKCVVHHATKSFEYGFAYLGGYACPVLTPVCDRVLLAMSTALSLEAGCLLHTSSSSRSAGKRTLARELAATVGVTSVDYNCSVVVGFDQFLRMTRGLLQSEACWLCIAGLESAAISADAPRNLIRAFAHEMNRLKDAVHARQDAFPLDGEMVDIVNPTFAVIVTAHLEFAAPAHQELVLQLSSAFVPVSCVHPEYALIWETVLHASGMKHWKALSKQFTRLLLITENDPEPFADVSLTSLHIVFAIARRIAAQCATRCSASEEKRVLLAFWDVLRARILPSRRVAFVKAVRSVLPLANSLEFTPLGMLATRVDIPQSNLSPIGEAESAAPSSSSLSSSLLSRSLAGEDAAMRHDAMALGYDSDEGETRSELAAARDLLVASMTAKHLVPSESILRKLMELYTVVSRSIVTVVVGNAMSGKSSAIDVLGSVFAAKSAQQRARSQARPEPSQRTEPLNSSSSVLAHRLKIARIYPAAFCTDELYGHFNASDGRAWEDGYLAHFFRQNCETSLAFRADLPTEDEAHSPLYRSASQSASRRVSRRGSVALTNLGGVHDTEAQQLPEHSSSTAWLVIDGMSDASALIEPLKDIARVSVDSVTQLVLPNGDQLRCDNPDMRVFCELESLQQWSPASLSYFGLVYLESDHVLPYTLLIKSWSQREVAQLQHAESSSGGSVSVESIEFAAKFMRSLISPLLEVCKRNVKPFMAFLPSHLVARMLQMLSVLLGEMAACGDNSKAGSTTHTRELKAIVAYAMTLSFGLLLQTQARAEFSVLIMRLVPELHEMLEHSCVDPSSTVFDVGLRFENHRATFFHWSALMAVDTALSDAGDWHSRVFRRSSSATASSKAATAESNNAALGSTLSAAASSAHIFIPTPQTISTEAWLALFGAAKAHALVFGDAAAGKRRLLHRCAQRLEHREGFLTATLQLSKTTPAREIQSAVETGLPRKLKALYCPGAGKRAVLVTLENLNLEAEERSAAARPCSEMIRQLCDARGSFVRATKAFAEFKDVVVWASFSLSPFGYPRLSSRLLRHFHLILLPDQSDAICKAMLSTFPPQFTARFACDTITADVTRVCRLPVELFKAARKYLKPTSVSPMLLFSVTDVIKHLSLLMNVSPSAMEEVVELELLSLRFAHLLFCTRSISVCERDVMTQLCQQTARRLRFDSQSLARMGDGAELLFADGGDGDGFARIPYSAALSLFRAGEERFHWYYRSAKESAVDDLAAISQIQRLPQLSAAAPSEHHRSGMSSPRSETAATFVGTTPPLSGSSSFAPTSGVSGIGGRSLADQPAEAQRRYSLVIAARKSTNDDRFTTPSPHLVRCMLDVYTLLQDGVRDLLLVGADTATRRRTTRVACGAQSLHFKEISSQVKTGDFEDQLKSVVLDTGLKSMPTVLYLDCDFLSHDEFELAIELATLHDVPARLYSAGDRAQILGFEHQHRVALGSNNSFTVAASASSSSNPSKTSLPWVDNSPPSSNLEHAGSLTHTRSAFHENLKRCLFIALSFGAPERLLEVVCRCPSVYYHAGVTTFQPDDDRSLDSIASAMLDSCEPLGLELTRLAVTQKREFHDIASAFRAMLIDIHRIAMTRQQQQQQMEGECAALQIPDAKRRAFAAVRSSFVELLRVFKLLFVFQKRELREQIAHVEMAVLRLQRMNVQVDAQLAREVDGETQLHAAKCAVVESTDALREREAAERDAKRAFLLDEQRCAVLQSDIEREREVIQLELAKTLPDLMQATESLAQINKYHITEMKSFTNPPQLVRLVMQAVCVLLGSAPTWAEALRILADIRFIERLRGFDRDHVDPALIERVKLFINHPDFSMENMKRASLASTTLCKWVLAIVRYSEVMKHVAPTQKKLEATEHSFQVIDELVQAERRKLISLELEINELRAAYARNAQFEEDLQRSHDSRVKWKSAVADFAVVLAAWRATVAEKHRKLEVVQDQLIEHCAVIAATTVYAGAQGLGERELLVQKWTNAIRARIGWANEHKSQGSNDARASTSESCCSSVPTLVPIVKHWTLSGRVMVQELKHALLTARHTDSAGVVVSLFLTDQTQKVCLRYPLFFDPLNRAAAWLKDRFALSGSTFSATMAAIPLEAADQAISGAQHDDANSAASPTLLLILDAGDPQLISTIEKQVTQKTPPLILIENLSESEESALNALFELLALLQRVGETTIFFSTRSLARPLAWTPKIWDQLALINFAPTPTELETQFLSLFFQTVSVESCAESEWTLLQSHYATETIKEKVLLDAFISSVRVAVESRRKPSGGAAAAVVSSFPAMWATDLETHADHGAAALPEEDMQRITKQLDEYKAARAKRKQLQQCVEQCRGKRKDVAAAFAKRLRALVDAEEKLHAVDATVPLSLLVIIESLRDATERAQSEAFYTDFINRQEALAAEHGDALESLDKGSDSSLALLAEQAAAFVSMRYLEKRLTSLPTRLHSLFLFFVAFSVAEVNGEGVEAAVLEGLLTDDLLRELHASPVASSLRYFPSATASADTDPSRAATVSRLARHVASLATEVALLSVSQRLSSASDDIDVSMRAHESRLDAPVRLAFLRIQSTLVRTSRTQRRHTLSTDLLADMLAHSHMWCEYLGQSVAPSLAPTASPASPLASTRTLNIAAPSAPPWIATQLAPLEQLLVHLCLFHCLPAAHLHEFVASQLGQPMLRALSTRLDSESKRNLASVAKASAFSTPIVLVSSPSCQVSTGLSSLLQCAQRLGIREDALACISMGSDTSIANFRLGEFSHSNLVANVITMNYSEAMKSLSGIKESSLSGGWIVVKDTEYGSLAATNALRQQVESMARLHSNKSNDFRLWVQCEVTRGSTHRLGAAAQSSAASCRAIGFAAHGFLSLLFAERRFVEFPQTLAQYYAAHLCEDSERAAEQNDKQQQQLVPSQRPKMMARCSSFSLGKSQAAVAGLTADPPAPEKWWVQAALWVFHAVFRLHHDCGGMSIDWTHGRNETVAPHRRSHQVTADLFASHFELERSLRLLQLHTRLKVLAATAATSSGNAAAQSTMMASASLSSSETRTMVELVAIVYMGRQCDTVRARQCCELLEWCLAPRTPTHYTVSDAGSAARDMPSTQLRSRVVSMREKILHKKLAPAAAIAATGVSSSSVAIEATCLPLQLQRERECCESVRLLRGLRIAVRATAGGTTSSAAALTHLRSSGSGRALCLETAQRSLRRVLADLPSKTSLSSSVEQQRIQRHSSVFAAYRRGTSVDSAQARVASQSATVVWHRALLTRLVEVELPAIEAYLQYVWRMSELILSLTPDSRDAAAASGSSAALYQEVVSVLDALSTGAVPVSWQCYGSNECSMAARGCGETGEERYAMPLRLTSWQHWLRQAVEFYQRLQARPRHLIDVVWIPALRHPRAFLFSFRSSVAEANDAGFAEISLSLAPPPVVAAKDKLDGEADASLRRAHSSLASIAIAGLSIANAAWSDDLGALVESSAGIAQRLPVLHLHASTHFQFQSEAGSTLGFLSTRRSVIESEQPLLLTRQHSASSSDTSISASAISTDPISSSSAASSSVPSSSEVFYRCPLFRSRTQRAPGLREHPIAFIYVPTDQAASLMSVHGAALFLSSD